VEKLLSESTYVFMPIRNEEGDINEEFIFMVTNQQTIFKYKNIFNN